jgi:hypothetical protein
MRGRASSQLFWRASAPTPKTHPESLPTKVRPCLFRGHRDRHRLDGAPVESVSALPRARGFTGTRMEFADPRQALPRARGFTERVGGRSLKALPRARGCTNGKRSGERRQSGLPRARGLTLSEGQHGGLASGSPTRARGFTDRHGRGRAGLWALPRPRGFSRHPWRAERPMEGSPTCARVHRSPPSTAGRSPGLEYRGSLVAPMYITTSGGNTDGSAAVTWGISSADCLHSAGATPMATE